MYTLLPRARKKEKRKNNRMVNSTMDENKKDAENWVTRDKRAFLREARGTARERNYAHECVVVVVEVSAVVLLSSGNKVGPLMVAS